MNLNNSDNSVNKTGIISSVLQGAITSCCLECLTQNASTVDLQLNGLSELAEAATEEEMKARIGSDTDISFPVYGHKYQDSYGGNFAFTPLIESPGVALVTQSSVDVSVSTEIATRIFNCWPLVVVTMVLASLAGVLIWMLVNNMAENNNFNYR